MKYYVVDINTAKLLHQAETRALCNQWIINSFSKNGKRYKTEVRFDCPHDLLIMNEKQYRYYSMAVEHEKQKQIRYKCYNYGILEFTGTKEEISRRTGESIKSVMLALQEDGRIRKGPFQGWRFERVVA